MKDKEYKEWLIGELYLSEQKKDLDKMETLGCELYECFQWAGTPYATHTIDIEEEKPKSLLEKALATSKIKDYER